VLRIRCTASLKFRCLACVLSASAGSTTCHENVVRGHENVVRVHENVVRGRENVVRGHYLS